jgi:hypothetical protein
MGFKNMFIKWKKLCTWFWKNVHGFENFHEFRKYIHGIQKFVQNFEKIVHSSLKFVRTEDRLSNIMTKALGLMQFQVLRRCIGIIEVKDMHMHIRRSLLVNQACLWISAKVQLVDPLLC